jgi:hypothetical protein
MFTNLGSHCFARIGWIAGMALFAVAFLLPSVRDGATHYPGWVCAWETLCWTVSFFATVRDKQLEWWSFYMMVSGWISPLVLFGLIAWSGRIKRGIAKVLPFLLLAPWAVFALSNGADPIRPSIGHYIWTAGCLLIFSPEYVTILAAMRKP